MTPLFAQRQLQQSCPLAMCSRSSSLSSSLLLSFRRLQVWMATMIIASLLLAFTTTTTTTRNVVIVHAWTWSTNPQRKQPISKLLQDYARPIAELKTIATQELSSSLPGVSMSVEPYSNDVFYLKYCLEYDDGDDFEAAKQCLIQNLAWRCSSRGRDLCQAARMAVRKATDGSGGGWNNDPVLAMAPYSTEIASFLTPQQCLTTTSSQGDLIYCIRAGQIDDVNLMEALSIEQLADFFLYAKEVNFLVSLQRSLDSNALVSVITANDLSGVKLLGGSSEFRQALGASSMEAESLYPATDGPTLLLNLPIVLNALVKLFTPLLAEKVKA